MRAALQMKALGTKPGVTDLIMLPPIDNRGLFPAYFLEAKAPKGGTLSGDQKNFRAEVLTSGLRMGHLPQQ
jgi:hypothetical protein